MPAEIDTSIARKVAHDKFVNNRYDDAFLINEINVMKIVLLWVALLFSSQLMATEFATELKSEALEGAWVIISMAGMADEDGDMWEFEDGLFYQNLGGRRISPDKYTVKGEVVDLDGYHFKVLEFDGQTMKADMAGFVYELKKK